MYKSMIIHCIVICLLVSVFCASPSVCAGDNSMQNVLPSGECAEDWVMKGKVSLYTRATLSDHINGEAELYFPYGFDLVATAAYVNRKNSEVLIVADVYRMSSLLNAFGIYSNYRKTDAAWVAVGAEAFISPSQLMFYQDRYFVRLQATGTMDLKQDIFLACGYAVSRNLPRHTGHLRELEAMRISFVVPRSERYIAQSLLGYDFFRRGIIADATLNNERVQVFVVPEVSQAAAQEAFDRYCSYLKTEGKDFTLIDKPGGKSMNALDPLYGGVFVVQSGRYLIGAVRVKEVSAAEQMVEQLRRRIVKTTGIF
jgi:hypothetical protein